MLNFHKKLEYVVQSEAKTLTSNVRIVVGRVEGGRMSAAGPLFGDMSQYRADAEQLANGSCYPGLTPWETVTEAE